MIDPLKEQTITLPAAARLLGRHKDTLRAWAAKGLLETVQMGGRVYTSREALERMAQPGPVAQVQTPAQKTRRERELVERLQKQGLLR